MNFLPPTERELEQLCRRLTPGMRKRFVIARERNWRFEYKADESGSDRCLVIVAPCEACGSEAVCRSPSAMFHVNALHCKCGWSRSIPDDLVWDCEAIRENFPALYE